MNAVPVLLDEARRRLGRAGNPSARVDAELLLAHVLARPRGALLLAPEVTDAERSRFQALVDRRALGEPLQHLTGSAPFRHLLLGVGPGVFIPRPETEWLVELATPALDSPGPSGTVDVVDLCAGSGAIALSVAHEHRRAQVTAVEFSEAALLWLRRNAEAQVAAGDPPVTVVAGDVRDPELLADRAATVAVVLSNPPYVPEVLRPSLSTEVGHDPDVAVFGGPDGTSLLPAVIACAARLLRPGGLLLLEHDESHEHRVPELLSGGDWEEISGHRDLTGRPRFTGARRVLAR